MYLPQFILVFLIGLCIWGKPLGIVGSCWLASKFNLALYQSEISWPQLIGGSNVLLGVGFTMSIVVAICQLFDGEVIERS